MIRNWGQVQKWWGAIWVTGKEGRVSGIKFFDATSACPPAAERQGYSEPFGGG